MDIKILLQQKALNKMGFPCGQEDGIRGLKFEAAMSKYLRRIPIMLQQRALDDMGYAIGTIDGIPGPKFDKAFDSYTDKIKVVADPKKRPDVSTNIRSEFPSPNYRSMVAFYGKPGNENNLVKVKLPYRMRLYTRDAKATIEHVWVHRKCAQSLVAVLQDIYHECGLAYIKKHGLDVYCGIYNNRSVRNGVAKSKHAWGCAIDINASENMNRQKWSPRMVGRKGWGNMPVKVVKIFERHGWKSGGRAWGRDAMHFQATK